MSLSDPCPVRRAPLGWGQQWQWLFDSARLARGERPEAFTFTLPAPAGLSSAALRCVLAELLERHETLRTRYHLTCEGSPVQVVMPAEEPDLALLPAGAGDDLTDLATRLPQGQDLVNGPVVTAVATHTNGYVRDVVVAVPSLAVDGAGLASLMSELAEMMMAAAGGPALSRQPVPWQPADQALSQATQPGARHDQAARYCLDLFATAPHATLPFYWWPRPPGLPSLATRMLSAELAQECHQAARSLRVSVPAIYLALVTTVIRCWTGHDNCVVGVTLGNRTAPLQASVGRYVTTVPLVVDFTGDPPFSVLARRAMQALLTATRHGYHDVGAMVLAAARESVRRGALFTTAIDFNYHNFQVEPPPFADERLPSDPHWEQSEDPAQTQPLRIDIYPHGDRVMLRLRTSQSLLPPAAARAFLDQLRTVMRLVLRRGDPRLSELSPVVCLPGYWNVPGWLRIGDAWVSRDDVADLLTRHKQVAAAAVFPTEAKRHRDRVTLTAYVVPDPPGVTIAELHGYMRDAVSTYPSTMLPHRYLIRRSTPSDSADPHAWAAQPPAIPPPTGHPGPPDPRVAALLAAFLETHPGRPAHVSASYSELYGEFTRIPAVLDRLAANGYGGLRFAHLIGMAPLGQLATRLQPDRR